MGGKLQQQQQQRHKTKIIIWDKKFSDGAQRTTDWLPSKSSFQKKALFQLNKERKWCLGGHAMVLCSLYLRVGGTDPVTSRTPGCHKFKKN